MLHVLRALRRHDRPMRFSELRRLLDGITQKMLTRTRHALPEPVR
ncbi:winged helix-turn-helix transcriptional regulator [Streptomyces filipinensis]|nr:winged helix-turn-helix transcriptional regulator [Streptomyces filipinensis]